MTQQTHLRKRLSHNDFVQADRGQPAQCSQKHRSDHARRQAALTSVGADQPSLPGALIAFQKSHFIISTVAN